LGSPAFGTQYNVRDGISHRQARSRLLLPSSQAREHMIFVPLAAAFILRYRQGTLFGTLF